MAVSRIQQSSILQGFPKSRSLLAGNSAYIPSSFESIATINGTGSSGTITFSSIPSIYKHLQIRFIANDANGYQTLLRFNSDSGSNYSYHGLYGGGSSVAANGFANSSSIAVGPTTGYVTNTMAVAIIDIHDYADTSKNKTVRSFNGVDFNGSGEIRLHSGLWRSTAAITSISIFLNANTFLSNSTFALYGIKG